jgi:membrane fusion protein, multidrug efflux system
MKKLLIGAIVVVSALAAVAYSRGMFGSSAEQTAQTGQAGQGGTDGRGGGRRGGGAGQFAGARGGFGRGPMTVEVAKVVRASISDEILVVGNLIGDATVTVVPRAAGRLQDIYVRLGDRVNRGQRLAKIEDYEIVEQVKQAEAAQEVSLATIRQREADLKQAQTSAERSRSLYERQLLPKQTLDDNEARYQAAIAQLDLARAQSTQSKARLEELRINLANTTVTSPVNGFVARRAVDPGAYVSQQAPVADVVDITTVRLVANVVEKDLKQMKSGDATRVQVDAYPGETFKGRIARVSPVLDPATRTAPIEIEIPNGDFRLKPGMYARVGITTDIKKDALVVPVNAVVDLGGRRGVFQPQGDSAVFHSVQVGTEEKNLVEILGGINEGDFVITTGAGALRDGDRVIVPGRTGGGGRNRRGGDTAAGGDGPSQGTGQPSGSRQGGERQGGTSPRGNATDGQGPARDNAAGRESFAGREGRQFSGEGGRKYGGDGSQRSGGDGSGRRSGGDGSGRRNGGAPRPPTPSSQE